MSFSKELSLLKASIVSLEERQGMLEQSIYRDTASLRDLVASKQLRIDISLDAISRSLQVLQSIIGPIVPKMESIGNMVIVLQDQVSKVVDVNRAPIQGTTLPKTFPFEWNQEDWDWFNSLNNIQESTPFPDIRCYETTSLSDPPVIDLRSPSHGTGEVQVQVKVGKPTKSVQRPM